MAAGGLVVAAGLAGDAYSVRRGVFASGTGDAYEPWRTWDRSATTPLGLVQAGILAANAHNAQAWRFAISGQRIDVYDDTGRSLGTVDAYRREVQLSVGCAVENIALAAQAAGLTPSVVLTPPGDPVASPVTALLIVGCGAAAIRATRAPAPPHTPAPPSTPDSS
jgi:hypothetical protein